MKILNGPGQGSNIKVILIRLAIALGIAIDCCFLSVTPLFAASTVVTREIRSSNFAYTKIGTSPIRTIVVYLPDGYDEVLKRYPVIYFLPDPMEALRSNFDHRDLQGLADRAITNGAIDKFILVSIDMSTPLGCSWYLNSPVTGDWEDFMIREVVPYIDANFKTLPQRNSRGIAGEFMGGYGAMRFGMLYPNVFGSVYALHPVGTGSGVQVMDSRPDWELLANARSVEDIKGDVFSSIFLSIFQAHLPDIEKPPLFVDLPAHKAGDQLVIDTRLTERLRASFFLESMIPQYAENLKSLRGFKFDWGRSDPIQDHVYANQALTHKLNEFGIAHEAEEYNGGWGDRTWGDDGRIYTDLLPFFKKHLVFEGKSYSDH